MIATIQRIPGTDVNQAAAANFLQAFSTVTGPAEARTSIKGCATGATLLVSFPRGSREKIATRLALYGFRASFATDAAKVLTKAAESAEKDAALELVNA